VIFAKFLKVDRIGLEHFCKIYERIKKNRMEKEKEERK
jgi:hypothetical protein